MFSLFLSFPFSQQLRVQSPAENRCGGGDEKSDGSTRICVGGQSAVIVVYQLASSRELSAVDPRDEEVGPQAVS